MNHSHDDEMINDMLDMAATVAENYIGLRLKKASWKMTIYGDLPSKIRLLYGPINKIESFKLYKNNAEISYLTENAYILDQATEVIYMRRSYLLRKAEITYSVGYDSDHLPSPIRQGMLEHLAKLYDMRGSDQGLPISAKSLYQPYKRVRF